MLKDDLVEFTSIKKKQKWVTENVKSCLIICVPDFNGPKKKKICNSCDERLASERSEKQKAKLP